MNTKCENCADLAEARLEGDTEMKKRKFTARDVAALKRAYNTILSESDYNRAAIGWANSRPAIKRIRRAMIKDLDEQIWAIQKAIAVANYVNRGRIGY